MSDVSIRPVASLGMVVLRGGPEMLGPALVAATGCAMPERRMKTASGEVTAMWMSPDEVMVTCPPEDTSAVLARLTVAIGGEFGTAIDMSAARQVFDLDGAGIVDLLAGLMPVDFARLAPTEVRRTRMAQIPVALWRHGDGWRLMCFRSVAGYAADLLRIGADAT